MQPWTCMELLQFDRGNAGSSGQMLAHVLLVTSEPELIEEALS